MLRDVVADDCQPWTWNRKRDVGEIVCRYHGKTGATVNYYSCMELADRYDTLLDDFFMLNPEIDEDCTNIQPNTEYCVKGYIKPPVATDGLCGPQHNNATCLGTEKQCCNSETWKCGDTEDDCRPGTCYEGACPGADVYAIDGKCGKQHNNLKCGGKWGDCCDNDGVCGTGAEFCGAGKCQSGNCTTTSTTTSGVGIPTGEPWLNGNTTDGTCGGPDFLTCNVLFGDCCSKDGVCGSKPGHCGDGCQAQFGYCGIDIISTTTVVANTTSTGAAAAAATM
ncbi:hypothetical protein AAE478_005667 [Parahypoxylon ruwenzoriense]